VGARPNFMKLAPLELQLRNLKKNISHKIVHTGQHYDYGLSRVFFKDLDLPEPDIYLGIGSSSHSDQTARIMLEFEKVVIAEKPDMVIVFGDVNSTLACSIVCSKIHYGKGATVPVAHIEAGLRSFDNTMPEEINRVVTDSLSKLLFVTEKTGISNLLKEGVSRKKMFLVGDTMIDSLLLNKNKIDKSGILGKYDLNRNEYILTTIHRPVNTDKKSNLEKIISIFEKTSVTSLSFNPRAKIVFPVHPRAMKMINSFGLMNKLMAIPNLLIKEPAGYSDFIKLLSECRLVITDSGGIQEEATFLRIPCLTLRDSFERPETLELGTNTLCGLNEKLVLSKVKEIFKGAYKKGGIPRLMDGKASERIVKIITQNL
jgi:UDP-N-acetylglucosamine 2-epimerase (non-hydrolysing)